VFILGLDGFSADSLGPFVYDEVIQVEHGDAGSKSHEFED
jgi:hypothetical protein